MPLHCQHAKTMIRLLFLYFYRQLPGNNVLTTKSALTSKIMMSVSRLELQHVAAESSNQPERTQPNPLRLGESSWGDRGRTDGFIRHRQHSVFLKLQRLTCGCIKLTCLTVGRGRTLSFWFCWRFPSVTSLFKAKCQAALLPLSSQDLPLALE